MKIHMVILAGIDNRGIYVHDTVRLSYDYFDSIRIADTGSTDVTRECVHLGAKVSVTDLSDWKNNWAYAYRGAVEHIPDGDWFIFLDSDERPSQLLLDHIRTNCEVLQLNHYNMGQIPNILHMDGRIAEGPSLGAVLDSFPKTDAEFHSKPVWTKSIILRKMPGMNVSTYGAHARFTQVYRKLRYLPHYYNHYKTSSQVAQSTVLCSWHQLGAYSVPVGTPEWNEHERLKKKYQILTGDQLMVHAKLIGIPAEMLELWAKWERHPCATMREYYQWAFVHKFGKVLHQVCGEECCKYKGEQL